MALSFEECLSDTPDFRAKLQRQEKRTEQLQRGLERVSKACTQMCDKGDAFATCVGNFLRELRGLGAHEVFGKDPLVMDPLNKFCDALDELEAYRTLLLTQAKITVADSLNIFIHNDMRAVRETGKVFHKISDDLDKARASHAACSKSRPGDFAEQTKLLLAQQTCFNHNALDYVFQINVLRTKERAEIVEKLLAYMSAQNSYFKQGHDVMSDLDGYMRTLAQQLNENAAEAQASTRKMEERHAMVQRGANQGSTETGNITEGYLFKRSHNTFRTWNWRFFVLEQGVLMYMSRSKDEPPKALVKDLRLCTVKPLPTESVDRRFIFEIVTPSKNWILQAESQETCNRWVAAIQRAISNALDNNLEDTRSAASSDIGSLPHTPSENDLARSSLQATVSASPGNQKCADCGQADPTWVSINLGVCLCIECSGIHRSLGVHVSKVRSLSLDKMEHEICLLLTEIGNERSRTIFERNPSRCPVPHAKPSDKRAVKEAWIKSKYVDRSMVEKKPPARANESLLECAGSGDLLGVLAAITQGADVNCTSLTDQHRTALIRAVMQGHASIAQLLLLNCRNCNVVDDLGQTALHYAADSVNAGLLCLLLKHGGEQQVKNKDGQDALAISLRKGSADCVTLLRLSAMQEDETQRDEWSHVELDFASTAAARASGGG